MLKNGTKIRIKNDPIHTKKRNLFTPSMRQYLGTTQVISEISKSELYPGIVIKGYLWDEKDVIELSSKRKKTKAEFFNPKNLNI